MTAEHPYGTDRNLFHISYEGGILEDPWSEPPPKMFLLTNSPEAAPDVPVSLEVTSRPAIQWPSTGGASAR